MYDLGHGVGENIEEALKWYRLAAAQKHDMACFNLAEMYRTGRGVEQNHEEAVRYLRIAAGQGLKEAQFNLAVLLANGQGAERDMVAAYVWFRLAADQKFGDADWNRHRVGERLSDAEIAEAEARAKKLAAEIFSEYGPPAVRH